ncbi:tetratricopeptide repeat protein [Sphingomonas sp. CJ99]
MADPQSPQSRRIRRASFVAAWLAGAVLLAGNSTSTPRVPLPAAAEAAYERGDYQAADAALAPATDACLKAHGETIACYDLLAARIDVLLSLYAPGPTVEPLARMRLDIARAAYGENDVETGGAYSDYAIVLSREGRRDEAEPLIRRDLAINLAVNGPADEGTIVAYINLATNLDYQGRYEAALALREEAVKQALVGLPAEHPLVAQVHANLGYTLQNVGRWHDAEAAYREGLRRLRANFPKHHPTIANALSNLATNLQTLGRYREARPLLEEAVESYSATNGTNGRGMALALNALAHNARMEGRHRIAIQLAERSLAIGRSNETRGGMEVSASHAAIGWSQLAMGDPGAALEHFEASLSHETSVDPPDPARVAQASKAVSEALLLLGRPGESRTAIERGLALLTDRPSDRFDRSEALALRAEAMLRTDDRAAAIADARAAVAGMEALGLPGHAVTIGARTTLAAAMLPDDPAAARTGIAATMDLLARRLDGLRWFDVLAQRELARFRGLYALAVRANWPGGDGSRPCDQACADAFVAAQQGTQLATASAVAMTRQLPGPLADLGRRRDSLIADRERLDAALVRGDGDRPIAAAIDRRRALDAQLAELDANARTLAGAEAAIGRPAPLTLDQAQQRLAPDQALLLVVPDGDGMFVWTITSDTARWAWHRSTPPTSVRPDATPIAPRGRVDRIDGAAKAPGAMPDGLLADLPAGKRIETVFISADAGLQRVSFAALPTGSQGGPMLGMNRALVHLPSVSGLGTGGAQRTDRPARLFAIGAPTLSRYPDGRPLAPLIHADGEMADAARAFDGGTVLAGTAATEGALTGSDALAQADFLLFSTHAVTADLDGRSEPGLVLQPDEAASDPGARDGFLIAAEVARMRLSARLVVLAACDTATPDPTLSADPYSGLARAFLMAGADAVLVTIDPVDDAATAALTRQLFRILARQPDLSPARALRLAIRRLARMEGGRWRDPRYWRSFVLVGTRG